MNIRKCKCCDSIIKKDPILQYINMPGKAQNFPDNAHLEEDKGINLDIYECPYCGLVQLLEPPVDYYKDVIRATAVSDDMREFRKAYFHEFIYKHGLLGKKIVEIGAGCGEYMEIISGEAVEVYGIEHLEESVRTACRKGFHVFQGFIENALTEIPEAPYDAFYIMNFLEHIPEPKEFLKGILNNLKKDGYGLIEVPNGDFIFEHHMFSEFMLDHLLYFSKESLCQMLELSGFKVISCEVIWQDYIISAVVRPRKGISAGAFEKDQKKKISEVRQYINKMQKQGKKVAVWGAGHQALAFLSLANLQDCLECVIDSAEFKQNKYTPATHIPVVAPSQIKALGIEAIIIMAGSYSDEVQRIIQRNYKEIDILKIS